MFLQWLSTSLIGLGVQLCHRGDYSYSYKLYVDSDRPLSLTEVDIHAAPAAPAFTNLICVPLLVYCLSGYPHRSGVEVR